jgi:RNA polymerase sigma factor (sigma-70 family)
MPSLSPTQPGVPAPQSLASAQVTDAVLQHGDALTHYAAKILGCHEQARDVVQDTFVKLYETHGSIPANATRAWLYRVCRNRALDLRRRGRFAVALGNLPEPSVEPRGERARILSELDEMLRDLPDHKRQVMALRYGEGQSYKEISAETGLSVSHVGTVLHDVTESLRGRVAIAGLVVLLIAVVAAIWSQPEPLEAKPWLQAPTLVAPTRTPLELEQERHVEVDETPATPDSAAPRPPQPPPKRHTFESNP